MYTKKAQVPIIKVIVIIFTIAIFLISWILILNLNIAIDERKINTQLAIKKIIDGNCFSDQYATIQEDKFNQETLQQCYGKNNVTKIRLKINNEEIYLTNKDDFNREGGKCSQTSTLFCTELKYPILYKTKNKIEIKELKIQTITK